MLTQFTLVFCVDFHAISPVANSFYSFKWKIAKTKFGLLEIPTVKTWQSSDQNSFNILFKLHWSVNKTVISASLFPPELFSKVHCFWIGLQLSWSQGKSIQTSVELTITGSLIRLQSNHLLSLVSFLALELRFKERQGLNCMCFSPYVSDKSVHN